MSHPTSEDCLTARRRIFDGLRGDAEAEAAAEAHSFGCADCRAVRDSARALISGAREAAHEELPAEMAARVLARLGAVGEARAKAASRAPSWRGVWLGLGLGALATAAAVAFVVGRGAVQPGSADAMPLLAIDRVSGEVTLQRAGGVVPLGVATPVRGGDRLALGNGSRAALRIGASQFAASEGAVLRLSRLEPTRLELELERGRLVSDLHQESSQAMQVVVRIPGGSVTDIGTLFEIIAAGERRGVAVERGVLRVDLDDGRSFTVKSGEQLSLGALVRAGPLSAEHAAELRAALGEERPEALSEPGEAAEAPSQRTAGARPPKRAARAMDLKALEERASAGQCEAVAAELEAMADEAPGASEVVLAVANCFASRGEREAALRFFTRAAAAWPERAAGQNALFERARLLAELGRHQDASEAFAEFTRRYPEAALAPEAAFRVCTLAVLGPDRDEALRCLRDFRQRHATGKRLGEALFMEATLLRSAFGDCRAALSLYDEYLKRPRPLASEARQWRDWCARKLED